MKFISVVTSTQAKSEFGFLLTVAMEEVGKFWLISPCKNSVCLSQYTVRSTLLRVRNCLEKVLLPSVFLSRRFKSFYFQVLRAATEYNRISGSQAAFYGERVLQKGRSPDFIKTSLVCCFWPSYQNCAVLRVCLFTICSTRCG